MSTIQTCKCCLGEKPRTDFYFADNTCKECRKALVRANRAAKVEYYRAYDRERQKDPARREQGLLSHKAIRASKEGRIKRLEYQRRYRAKQHPLANAAHLAAERATRAGKLIKGTCVVCGSLDTLAHHYDYNTPLDVTWMCVLCHTRHHASPRGTINQVSA